MNLAYDIRHGVRTLRISPGFTLTAIVTLALGIGATTAVFSLADAMLWKPIPLPNLDRLAMVVERRPDPKEWKSPTPADADDIARQSDSLQSMALWQNGLANIVGSGGEPERVFQYLVSPNFFEMTGVAPARGRAFLPGEDQPGREQEVVLSDRLWRRRFGGDPDIVGKFIRLDDQNFLVTGIMPPDFVFP